MVSAEQAARKTIDELLEKAGWRVCDLKDADLHASRGVAIREFPLESRALANPSMGRNESGYPDYLPRAHNFFPLRRPGTLDEWLASYGSDYIPTRFAHQSAVTTP
jgi:hypothetical protein